MIVVGRSPATSCHTLAVSFELELVDRAKSDRSNVSFVYMMGAEAFGDTSMNSRETIADSAVAALRREKHRRIRSTALQERSWISGPPGVWYDKISCSCWPETWEGAPRVARSFLVFTGAHSLLPLAIPLPELESPHEISVRTSKLQSWLQGWGVTRNQRAGQLLVCLCRPVSPSPTQITAGCPIRRTIKRCDGP